MLTSRHLLQVVKELRHQNDPEIKIFLWNTGTKMKLEKLIKIHFKKQLGNKQNRD